MSVRHLNIMILFYNVVQSNYLMLFNTPILGNLPVMDLLKKENQHLTGSLSETKTLEHLNN